MEHVRALRAMNENYRWSGIAIWMRSNVRIPGTKLSGRGIVLWLRHPEQVRRFQDALADGVFF